MTFFPEALKNTEIRRLLLAQLPADFADWLDFVAIGALLAFTWNAEPYVFAILAVAMGLPYLVVGPFAGVLVDRADTKTVMIWSNLGRGMVTASFFFAPGWPVLLALIAVRSTVDSFFTPAKQSALQALTTPTNRTSANGLSHGINQAAKIAAPALGGSLLIWVAPQVVFLLNAGVSFVAAVLLMRLAPMRSVQQYEDGEKLGMYESVKDGFAMVLGKPILKSALFMMAAGFFAMFLYDTLIAPLTRDMGFSQTDLGLALASVGAGGVFGAILMGISKGMGRPFIWIAFGSVVSGVVVAGLGVFEMFGLPVSRLLFFAAFGLLGISSAISVVPFRIVIQNTVPENSIGRITALSEALNTFALLFAPFIGAGIASVTSIGGAFVFGGFLMVAIAAWAFSVRTQSPPKTSSSQ